MNREKITGRTWADVFIEPPRWLLYAIAAIMTLLSMTLLILWVTGSEIEIGEFRIGPVLAQTPSSDVPSDGSPITISIDKPSALFVTGGATGQGGSDFRSSLSLKILINGEECATNQTYLPNNWVVDHRLSALCVVEVEAKVEYILEVIADGDGVTNISKRMTYIALPM